MRKNSTCTVLVVHRLASASHLSQDSEQPLDARHRRRLGLFEPGSKRSADRLGAKTNVFNVVVSPADARVVWAMAIDINEMDSNVPSQGRHIYRSVDGGRPSCPSSIKGRTYNSSTDR